MDRADGRRRAEPERPAPAPSSAALTASYEPAATTGNTAEDIAADLRQVAGA